MSVCLSTTGGMAGIRTVTVVDDEPSAARATVEGLREAHLGATVHGGRSRDGPPSPESLRGSDCVVTEIDLPGASGLSFAERAATAAPELSVVVYTARGDEETASRAFSVGVDDYVRKAEGVDALCEAIDRLDRRVEVEPTTVDGSGGSVGTAAVAGPVDAETVAAAAAPVDPAEPARELDRLRAILESVGEMVYTLDGDGTVTFANGPFARFFGHTVDGVVGTDVAELFPTEGYETTVELVEAVLESEETNQGRFEFHARRPSGDEVVLESQLVVAPEGAELGAAAGVLRNVTEKRARERTLRERNERLEEFATVLSHDIRNPLTVVAGTVELVRETGDLSRLSEVEACVDRIDDLVDDLLALARGGRAEAIERVPLGRAATEAWRAVETDAASLELAEELGAVEADPTRLGQLFENLFANAVDHGADGRTERLTVTVEPTPEGFAVADDGHGVDPAVADRLFERGVTTDDRGTGVGLSIVSTVADAHGWTVSLDGSYDDGARFVVRTG